MKLDLKFKINKPVLFVFEYLTDMQKFASVHPIISKIESKSFNNYLVFETLKWFGIPFSFTYFVHISFSKPENKILYNATVMKFTKITMEFELAAIENSTEINETITFHSPLPISNILKKIFIKQHIQLFRNIDNLP